MARGNVEGGAQVAANEDALQQLHQEQHEDVENGLAELERFLVRVQLLQYGPQEISAGVRERPSSSDAGGGNTRLQDAEKVERQLPQSVQHVRAAEGGVAAAGM